MFAYSYTPKGFGGITFEWDGHNKIKVGPTNDEYKVKFTCFQKDSRTSADIEGLEINQWLFLSCAIDYEDNILYMNATTQDNIYFMNEKHGMGYAFL